MMKSHRMIVLASALAVLPASALFAQTGGSSTADQSRLGRQTGAPTNPSPSGMTPSQNSHVPGATGQTVVPGSNSTVSGDRGATELNKTGSMPGGSGSGK